jgi:hypothetical protein
LREFGDCYSECRPSHSRLNWVHKIAYFRRILLIRLSKLVMPSHLRKRRRSRTRSSAILDLTKP